jgi:type IV secretory pathway VirB4 component
MEQVIDGRRFIYWMDEFWKWLGDDAFSEFAFNKQKTIRKQNGLGVFATQSPSDVLKSPIAKAIIEQSATMIFLPNPTADEKDYVEGFKTTKMEYEFIRSLAEDSRCFVVKQGHRSTVCRLDLGGGRFDDELAVLSGSTDNLELLESALDEVGYDPKDWLPLFHEKRKHRSDTSRLKTANVNED